MAVRQRFVAWGLVFESEVHIDALPPAGQDIGMDASIHYGDVPEELDQPLITTTTYQATARQFLLNLEGLGRFLVQNGTEIRVAPSRSGHDWIWSQLVGTLFGVLLVQRGLMVLHASAVLLPRGAALFAGTTGSGKSTLLAHLLQRGHRMIADDLCVLRESVEDGRVYVAPGLPFFKLWSDSADYLGWSLSGCRQVRAGLRKYIVPAGKQFVALDQPVSSLFILGTHNDDDLTVASLHGAAAFKSISQQLRHRRLVSALRGDAPLFGAASRLADTIPITSVVRPRGARFQAGVADIVESQ